MTWIKKQLAKPSVRVQLARAARLFLFTAVPLLIASHNYTMSGFIAAATAAAEVVYRQYFPPSV